VTHSTSSSCSSRSPTAARWPISRSSPTDTPSRRASMPRIRARSCATWCGHEAPPPETVRVDAGISDGDEIAALRPADREARRARHRPRRRARPARRRARGDGGRGGGHEPAVPPLARRASRLPRGELSTGLPDAVPAALAPPPRAPPGPWDGAGASTSRPRRRSRRSRSRRRRSRRGRRAATAA
jgi:hypothetical protein